MISNGPIKDGMRLLWVNSSDPDSQYKGRILAVIVWGCLLSMLGVSVFNLLQELYAYTPSNAAMLAAFALLLLINRLGFVRLASALTVALLTLGPFLLLDEAALRGVYFVLAFPIFVAGFLLTPWSGILIAFAVIGLSMSAGIVSETFFYFPGLALAVFGLLVYLFAENVRAAQRKYRGLFENAVEGIYQSTLDGRLITANPSMARMFGYNSPQHMLSSVSEAGVDLWEDLQQRTQLIHRLHEQDSVSGFEVRGRRKDSREFWFSVNAHSVKNKRGEMIGFEGAVEDITERKRAESELRTAHQKLSFHIENSPVGILEWDRETRILSWSNEAENLFGWKSEEVVGKLIGDLNLIHEEDVDKVGGMMEQLLSGRERQMVFQNRNRRNDGSVVYCKWYNSALSDESGELISVMSLAMDITERELAQKDLKESEERFRALTDAALEALVISENGIILEANRTFVQTFGYEVKEVVGKSSLDIMDPEFRDLARENIRSEHRETYEAVGLTKDGTRLDLEIRGKTAAYRGRKVRISALRDVTERKKAEEALRESEHQFQQLFEQSVDALLVHDGQGRIVDCNAEACRSLGYSREEMLRLRVSDFATNLVCEENEAPNEDGTLWQRALISEPGVSAGVHVGEHRRKDGTTFPVEVRVSPIDYKGEHMIFASARDITEREEAEKALREAEERYRTLVERMPAVTIFQEIDSPNPATYVSPQIQTLTGYSPEECQDPDLRYNMVHPDDRERIQAEDHRPYESGETVMTEYRILHRDGRTLWVRNESLIVEDKSSGSRYWQGSLVDITERKQAEDALREAEFRYRTLVEQIPAVLYIDLADGSDTVYISPQIEAMLGYTPEEWMAREVWKDSIHPDDRERVLAADDHSTATGEPFSDEYCLIARDGRVVWIRDEASLLRDESGVPLFWQGFLLDVTEQREAERARRKAEDRYRTLVEQLPAVTYREKISAPNADPYVSPQVEAMLGYSPQDFLGDLDLWESLIHPEDRERFSTADERASATSEPLKVEYRMFAKDGSLLWVRDEAVPVRDQKGGILYWQGVVIDITERRRLEERIWQQAFHDGLTGLPNRLLFKDRLDHALARRDQREDSIAVLFLDLDNFKYVNDSLGHQAGDQLLVEVAQRLKECVRPGDTLARLGGDEFTALLEDVGEAGAATRVVERILAGLQLPIVLAGREVFVDVSVGIAFGSASSEGSEELMRSADMAMYEAKKDGKSRYRMFDLKMEAVAQGRLGLETGLRRALEREELTLHYQPEIELQDGRIAGFEALLRWEHPTFGPVSPTEFIPLAEETGLIVAIGRWVLKEACRKAKEWRDRYDRAPMMSVNLSVRQLQNPGLVQDVHEALRESGLEPESLVLEITESVALNDAPSTTATLRELTELGVGLAIDDFGTGYSSLSYLRQLRADFLKMDRSFIEKLGNDPEDTILVSGVVNLAQSLGFKVIAEGVEEIEQVKWLRDLGCDFAQGYYFERPLSGEKADELLRKLPTMAYKGWLPEALSSGLEELE